MKITKYIWIGLLGFVVVSLLALMSGGMLREDTKPVGDAAEQKEFQQVLHVFDGDTFSIWTPRRIETVRVIGIDSPETGKKYRDRECFGKEATKKAIELLNEKKVRLESDPTQADRDKYNRILRYVYFEDGAFYNLMMIEEGFAEEYTFEDSQYEYQAQFRAAQEQAKENKRGLWGECGDNL